MAKKNYDELINHIVSWIGGESNVVHFTHCITRLRFNVKDKGLVQIAQIEQCPNVVGYQWSGEQLQIIIGQKVGEVYKDILKVSNLVAENMAADDGKVKKNESFLMSIMNGVSGSLTPLIPVLVAGGMLKICVILVELFGFGPETGTYKIFAFVSDSAFYFLPVFIGYGAAKKFNVNVVMGMFAGAILLAPDFVAMVGAGEALNLFGLPVYLGNYPNSVFPVILSVFVMSYVEKFFVKYSPEVIRSTLVPFGTILVMLPLILCVFGPLGNVLGNYVATGVIWMYDTLGFVGVGVFAALLPFIIFTGMHYGFFPYIFTMLGQGYEPFYCASNFVYNITQGTASLAVGIKTKKTNMKSLAASCGFTAILAGISEPALFGVTFKLKTPLWCSMAGSFVGGLMVGLFHIKYYAMGSFGIVGLPGFISKDSMNLIYMILSLIISGILTFVLTLLFYKDPDVMEE